jgi:Fe2+ or Zn2+ uptake regulation protein
VDFEIKKEYTSLVDGLEGYDVTDAQLYLKGICPDCKK